MTTFTKPESPTSFEARLREALKKHGKVEKRRKKKRAKPAVPPPRKPAVARWRAVSATLVVQLVKCEGCGRTIRVPNREASVTFENLRSGARWTQLRDPGLINPDLPRKRLEHQTYVSACEECFGGELEPLPPAPPPKPYRELPPIMPAVPRTPITPDPDELEPYLGPAYPPGTPVLDKLNDQFSQISRDIHVIEALEELPIEMFIRRPR